MPEPAPSHDYTDAARGERLQRVLADAGIGSRRACEELILAGEVEVNGQLVAELPAWVDPDEDRVVVQGRPLPRPERKLYVLLNKPARTLSTVSDEPGADRRTVTDLVDHPGASRLFPVGRLDYDTVGLILLTNDGELANRLTHPRYGVPKTYRVVVRGLLGEEAVAELERGIYLAERKAGQTVGGKRTAHVEIRVVSQNRQNTTLELTLREGRNRQVRRMMAAVGYPVRTLERVALGPVRLKGVARGAWRELNRDEVWALRRAAADQRHDDAVDAAPGASKRPARKKAGGTTGRSPGRGGKGAGATKGRRGREAYEPPPLDPGAPIRRRTIKNAINRGDRDAAPRRAQAAEDPGTTEPTPQARQSPARPASGKPGPPRAPGKTGTGKPSPKPSKPGGRRKADRDEQPKRPARTPDRRDERPGPARDGRGGGGKRGADTEGRGRAKPASKPSPKGKPGSGKRPPSSGGGPGGRGSGGGRR